jgi:hypothetical protein
VHVEWDSDGLVTPLGQLPFFVEYLKQALRGGHDMWVLIDRKVRFTADKFIAAAWFHSKIVDMEVIAFGRQWYQCHSSSGGSADSGVPLLKGGSGAYAIESWMARATSCSSRRKLDFRRPSNNDRGDRRRNSSGLTPLPSRSAGLEGRGVSTSQSRWDSTKHP